MDTKNIRKYIKRIKYYVENIKYIDEELTRHYKEEPTKLTTLIDYVKKQKYQIKKRDINSVIRRAITGQLLVIINIYLEKLMKI